MCIEIFVRATGPKNRRFTKKAEPAGVRLSRHHLIEYINTKTDLDKAGPQPVPKSSLLPSFLAVVVAS